MLSNFWEMAMYKNFPKFYLEWSSLVLTICRCYICEEEKKKKSKSRTEFRGVTVYRNGSNPGIVAPLLGKSWGLLLTKLSVISWSSDCDTFFFLYLTQTGDDILPSETRLRVGWWCLYCQRFISGRSIEWQTKIYLGPRISHLVFLWYTTLRDPFTGRMVVPLWPEIYLGWVLGQDLSWSWFLTIDLNLVEGVLSL